MQDTTGAKRQSAVGASVPLSGFGRSGLTRCLRLLALLLLPLATPALAQVSPACNLAANGSFELPNIQGDPANPEPGTQYTNGWAMYRTSQATTDGWQVVAGTIDILRYFNNASDGQQSIDLWGVAPSTIQQTFTGLIPGQQYTFAVDYSGLSATASIADVHLDRGAGFQLLQTLTAVANGVSNGNGGLPNTPAFTVTWATYTHSFIATGTQATIRFVNNATPDPTTNTGLFIDNFAFGGTAPCEDFGDAPASFGTLEVNNGARHAIPAYNEAAKTSPLMLGSRISADVDGQPSADASLDGFDDGVDQASVALVTGATAASVVVRAVNAKATAATIAGWIDFNGNGTFEAAERAQVTVPANTNAATAFTLNWAGLTPIPAGFSGAARVRIASNAANVANPVGSATDGEVEDSILPITQPLIGCSTDPSVFNTGISASGGKLPPGSRDRNWEAGIGTAAGGPASVGTWIDAWVTGNAAPGAWANSPFGNAEWTSFYANATHAGNVDEFHRYRFTLDSAVDPASFVLGIDFYSDNSVWEVYVNGQPQSGQVAGLPQNSGNPYFYAGFTEVNRAQLQLPHDWQIGSNELVVKVRSAAPMVGFLGQVTSTSLCPTQVAIDKSVDPPGVLTPGGTVIYTVTATNSGLVDAPNTLVTDAIPLGIASGTWTCAAASGALCPNPSGTLPLNQTLASFPGGGVVTYTITATVGASPPVSITNTANVTPPAGGTCYPDDAAPPCAASVTNPPVPIVSVVKSSAASQAVPGGTLSYEVVVRNVGSTPADGTTVSDPAPAGLSAASWTCTASGSAVCPNASGTGAINETIAVFPPGGELTYVVTATVDANPPAAIANTASVTPPGGGICSDGSAAPCDSTVILPAAPQIGISKAVSPIGPVVPGATLTYTITASNGGSVAAPGTVVSDAFPAGIDSATWTCTAAGGAVCPNATSGGAITPPAAMLGETIATFPVGGSVTYTVVATIAATPPATIDNTAQASVPGAVCVPGNTALPCVAAVSNPLADADVSISKALVAESGALAAFAEPGEQLTYAITLTNSGGTAATGYSVTDTLDPNALFVSADNGGTHVVGVVTWSGLTVPAGGSVTLTVVVAVVDPIPMGVTQIGNVAYETGTTPPDCSVVPQPASCVDVPVIHPPLQACTVDQLRATERWWFFGNRAGIDFDVSGTTATAVLNPQNVSTAEGSTVVTDFDGQLLFWSNASVAYTRDHTPMPNGSGLLGNPSATQTVAAFPALGSPGRYFIVTTDTDIGSAANGTLRYSVVDMSLNGGLGDIVAGQKNIALGAANTASEALTAVPNADGTGFWVLTYTNNSPNLLAYQFDGAGPVGGAVISTLSTNNGNSYGSLYFNKQLNSLALTSGTLGVAGQLRLLNFDAVTGIAHERFTWPVSTTGAAGTSRVYTADFSPAGDYLYVTRIFGGGRLYRYRVAGATSVADITSSMQFLGATASSQGGHVRRGADGRMYIPGNLNGTSLNVVNTPDDPISAGYVAGGFPLAVGAGTRFGLPQTVTGCPAPAPAEVTITKALTGEDGTLAGQAEAGEQLTYTITLTNTGGSPATNYRVTDALDPNTAFVSADNGGAHAAGVVSWIGLTVPTGGSLTLTVVVTVADPIPAGVTQIGNVAYETGTPPPACPPAGGQCVIVPIEPNVSIAKALTVENGALAGQAEPGEQLTYTITLSNTGGSAAMNFGVTDALDPNTVFVSADNGGAHAAGIVSWSGLTVPAGGSLTLTVVVSVADPIPAGVTQIGNVAYETGTTPPACPPAGGQCVIIPTAANVTIAKALTGENGTRAGQAEPGEQLTYTITLSNAGGSAATSYGVTDALDPNTAFVSADNGGAHAAGVVTWSGLTVPAGGSLTLTVVVTVADPIPAGVTQIGNVAYETGTTPPACPPAGGQCVIVPVEPIVTLAKSASAPLPTGTPNEYAITYVVTANNAGGSAGSYILTDALSFNGATVTAISAPAYATSTGDLQDGALGAFVAPAGGTIVTGENIAAQGTETWTYTVTYTVVDADVAADCSVPNGGLRNHAQLGGDSVGAPPADTCSGAPSVGIVKTATAPAPTGNPNEFTLTYTVNVANTGTLAGVYALDDTLTFNGATVTAISAPAYSSASDVQDGTLGTFAPPSGGTIVSGETIGVGGAEVWTYSVTYTVTDAATAQDCANPSGGLRNRAQLGGSLSGESTTCTGAAAVVIGKSASGPSATGNPDEYALDYLVTVQNNGTLPGSYDLSDTFTFAGVTVNSVSAVTHGGADSLASALGVLTATGGSIVTNETIAVGSSETYAYTVTFTIDDIAAVGTCATGGGLVNQAALGGSSSGQVGTCSDVPDVIIGKTAGAPTPTGTLNQYTLAYTVTVDNAGAAAGSYDLDDAFAFAGATIDAVSAITHIGPDPLAGTLGTLTAAGGTLVSGETIAAGSGESYVYAVTFTLTDPTLAGDCANPAGGLRNAANLGGSATGDAATCTGTPNVTITKALTGENGTRAGQAEPGEQLTYTITLSNAGGSAATNYGVTDALDPNTMFVSATNGGTHAAGVVSWSGLTVPAGGSLTLTVVVTVADPIPAGVTQIGNVAYETGTTPPLCPPAGGQCVIVPTEPVVTLAKSASAPLPTGTPNEYAITYVVTANNSGGSAGSYDLGDALTFNGATVTAISAPAYATSTGDIQDGALGAFVAPAGGTVVTGENIAAQGTETWTYTVTYTVVDADVAADCAVPNGGLRNHAQLGGDSAGAPPVDTCSGAPSVGIVKTATAPVPTGNPNEFTLTYTVNVANTGSLAGVYALDDTLTFNGASVTAISAPAYSSASDTQDGTLGTFAPPSGGTIVSGETIGVGGAEVWTYSVTYTVTDAATAQDCANPSGGLRNRAQLGGSLSGESTTCTGAAAVVIGKSASGPSATGNPDEYELNYLVTVQNNGSLVGSYDLSDTFTFAGVTVNSVSAVTHGGADPLATALGVLTPSGGSIVTNETIAAGSSETYAYRVTFTITDLAAVGSCSAGGGLINQAALGGSSSGQVGTCSDVPDVVVNKSAGAPVPTGTLNQYTITYTVDVTNAGAAVGSYDLDDAFAFAGATVDAVSAVMHAGPDALGTTLGTLTSAGGAIVTGESIAGATGESYSYTVTFTLIDPVLAGDCANPNGGLRNRAALGGSATGDAATCTGTPNVSLAKSVGVPTPTGLPNEYTLTYTVTATNSGGSTGSYDLGDALTFNGATVTAISAPAYATSTGDIQDGALGAFVVPAGGTVVTGETISAGGIETWTYSVTYTVVDGDIAADCSVPNGGLRNHAQLGGDSAGAPPVDTCSGAPSVSIVKTATAPVPTGSPNQYALTYTVNVANTGSLAGSYNLSDTLAFNGATVDAISAPAYTSASDAQDGTPGTFAPPSGGTIVSGEAISAAGTETWTYTVTYTVTDNAAAQDCANPNGGLRNLAELGGSLVGESTTCTGAPAVVIGKSASGPNATGNPDEYTLDYFVTVQNNGTLAGSYDLVDSFTFAGVSVVSVSAVVHGGSDPLATALGTLTPSGGTILLGETIAAGSSETYAYTVTFTIDDIATVGTCAAGGGLVNRAALGGSSAGQVGTCSDVPNVTVGKTAGTPMPTGTPNQYTLAYTVAVDNAGAAAGSYDLDDVFVFAGATIDAVSAIVHVGPDPLAGTLGTLTAAGGTIVSGETIAAAGSESYVYAVTFTLTDPALAGDCANPSGGLRNSAQLGGSAVGDAATCTGTPSVVIAKALAGENGSAAGVAEPGEQLSYTITLTNSGGTDATGYGVTDQLDPNTLFVSADNGGTHAAGIVTWANLTVPANGSLTLTAVVSVVDPIPAGVTQIANVAFETGTTPPVCPPVGGQCVVVPTAGAVTLAKALAGENGAQSGIAEPGEQLTYTITLTNTGGSAAIGYGVTDQLDPNTVFVSADNGGAHAAGVVTWAGLMVPANGTLTLTVVVAVADPLPAGVTQVANVAYQTGTTPPPCPPAGGQCVVVPTEGAVTLAKSVVDANGNGQAEAGETLTYTIVLANAGGSAVTNYGVTDPLDPNSSFVSADNGGTHAAGTVSWSGLTVPASGSLNLVVVVTVNDPLSSGVTRIGNLAYETGTTPPDCTLVPAPANCAEIPVAGVPHLLISKTADSANLVAGGSVIYTISVGNVGTADAIDAMVSDPLPTGIVAFAWTCSASGGVACPNASGSGAIAEAVAVFPVGGLLVYTVTATLSDNPPATVVNTATVTPSGNATCGPDGTAPPCPATVIGTIVPSGTVATPVPTLSTWMLLLLGMGMLALAWRCRRRFD